MYAKYNNVIAYIPARTVNASGAGHDQAVKSKEDQFHWAIVGWDLNPLAGREEASLKEDQTLRAVHPPALGCVDSMTLCHIL